MNESRIADALRIARERNPDADTLICELAENGIEVFLDAHDQVRWRSTQGAPITVRQLRDLKARDAELRDILDAGDFRESPGETS